MDRYSLGRQRAPLTRVLREGGCFPLILPAFAAAWLIALMLLFGSGIARAQSASEIEQARAAIARQSDLQLQLPGGEPEPTSSSSIELPEWILWVVIIGGLLFVLYYLRDIIPMPGWRRSIAEGTGEAEEGAPLAAQSPSDILLAADELAREGRYVDAMHVLLLKGLADIRQRLGEEFADSLTSREIMRRAPLSAAGASALREIVLGVERSYFGEHPVGPRDYEVCRRRFDELGAALAAGAGA
jgi:hypothetical protein